MRPILCLLLAACSTMLFGISITDRFNQETELSLEELSSVPRDTIETVRSKDGVVQSDLYGCGIKDSLTSPASVSAPRTDFR